MFFCVVCVMYSCHVDKKGVFGSSYLRSSFLTGLVRVTQQRFLLSPESWTGPVFHPGGDGELVCQVLGDHVIGNVGGLASVEPVDEVAVSAAVGEEGRRPVRSGAGGGEEVGAAGLCACIVQKIARLSTLLHKESTQKKSSVR